jgi:Flp pilus assembly protein TadD
MLRALVLSALLAAAPCAQGDAALRAAIGKSNEALKAGDHARALAHLGEARRLAPDDPRIENAIASVHLQLGLRRYKEGEFEAAGSSFDAVLAVLPGHVPAMLGLGLVRLREERLEEARALLEKVVEKEPGNPTALGVLGELAKQRGDLEAARDLLGRAAAAAPGNQELAQLADRARRDADVEQGFTALDQGPFRLQYRLRGPGVEAARPVLQMLGEAHAELSKALGGAPPPPITAVLYTEEEFAKVRTLGHWAAAFFDGRLRLSLKDWPARQALRAALRHELAHAFLHALHPQAPLWVHEGYAQKLEGGTRADGARRLRKAGGALPLAAFCGAFAQARDPQIVERGYAQSLAVVGYLLERQPAGKWREFLQRVGEGADAGQAAREVYGLSLEQIVARAIADL